MNGESLAAIGRVLVVAEKLGGRERRWLLEAAEAYARSIEAIHQCVTIVERTMRTIEQSRATLAFADEVLRRNGGPTSPD